MSSGDIPIMMYGAFPVTDPEEWDRRLRRLRETATLPEAPTNFTFIAHPVTKADLDAAVARIESQMLALLAEVKRLAAKPKRKKKAGR